ncbi:hypothetical protein BDZ89DRAFT_962476 [Hymenopellis radicata]|nr:hypothetical protein BDZ89DRAFT_962476 [Hymenopellis radicata]
MKKGIDGTLKVDGVLRVIRGDGNGPLFALLDTLRTHLHIDLSIREYTEHTLDADSKMRAPRHTSDSDISGAGLRAVLSAANNVIGDMELPELKLTVGFNAKSGQADISSVIVNSLGLELTRRFQAAFSRSCSVRRGTRTGRYPSGR